MRCMDSSTLRRSEFFARTTIAALARLLGSVVIIKGLVLEMAIGLALSASRKYLTTVEGRCWLYEAHAVRSHSNASVQRTVMADAAIPSLCQCMLSVALVAATVYLLRHVWQSEQIGNRLSSCLT